MMINPKRIICIVGGYKDLINRRIETLLIPYFFFSIIALIHGMFLGHDIIGMLVQILYSGYGCGAAAPMWFLSMLFVTSVAFTWITWNKKLSHIYSILLIVVVLSVLWLCIMDQKISHPYVTDEIIFGGGFPWHLRELPYWGALFLGGHLIRRTELRLLKNDSNNICRYSVLVMTHIILMAIIGVGFFMPIKNSIWAIVCPICLMSVIVYFVMYKPFMLLNRVFRSLHFISNNAIVILGSHVFIYGYIQLILKQNVFFQNHWVNYSVNLILISLILYYVVVPFMNRYMYRLVGKRMPL